MKRVPSGQTDATVHINWAKLRTTENKQPKAPEEHCISLTPFPTALSGLQWGILAVRDVGGSER